MAENTGEIVHASVCVSNELVEGSPQMIGPTAEQRGDTDPGGTDPADDPLDQPGEELRIPEEFDPNSQRSILTRSGGIPAK